MTKSESTVAAILSAAEALFLAKSYADVTMDQIAEKSRVTKGALYHHFSSKEELYLRMMQESFARMRTVLGVALDSGKGCRDRLGRLTRVFLELPERQSGLMRLVRRDVNSFEPPVREKLVRCYQAALPDLVEAAIRDGIRDGEVTPSDPRLLAWQFVATVEVILGRHADSVLRGGAAKLNYVLDLFFMGARARQGAFA